MWQPLSTLPASNAGALASYAPNTQVPPQVTPGGGGTGAPLQGGHPLHPLYSGNYHDLLQARYDRFADMGGQTGMHGGPRGLGGPMGGVADPSAWAAAMQGWQDDRPDGYGAAYDQFLAANPGAPAWGQPGFMQGGFRQSPQFGDIRQQFMDWRQARPVRSDY